MSPKLDEIIPSSFRDPSGFIFRRDDSIYRQLNISCKQHYDQLMECGLYQNLVEAGLMIPHDEVDVQPAQPDKAYKIIRPEVVPFISYPYEWCFSQLKHAALTTLKIQGVALSHGMSLKDCSAFNIQFWRGKAVLVDTLSFESYHEGRPWVAYGQFCRHFLGPLALMACKDIRLNQLFRVFIDGVPLDLVSALLPLHTRLRLSLLAHIHLHSRSEKRYAEKRIDTRRYRLGRLGFEGLIGNLASAISGLSWTPRGTEWSSYYEDTNYSVDAFDHKRQIVAEFLGRSDARNVWDLGGNVGLFSRLASDRAIPTVSFDMDPAAVEKNYLECVQKGETYILPLVLDLTSPSPAIGWENRERMSLGERGPADTVLALALVHHLAISNNVPLDKIADFFSGICSSLIVEFIPKSDSQVRRLLATREDVFPNYTQQCFENEFGRRFKLESCARIRDSQRTVYLMRRH